MKSILIFCLGIFGALAGTNSAQAQTASAEVWTVTIDVFSGQPNPTFTLDASEVAEVRARLNATPLIRAMTGAKETIIPARLGYRGMLIKATAGGKAIEDTEASGAKIMRKTASALFDGKPVGLEGYLLSRAVVRGLISPTLENQIKTQSRGAIQ
jgi:hypothetical protein